MRIREDKKGMKIRMKERKGKKHLEKRRKTGEEKEEEERKKGKRRERRKRSFWSGNQEATIRQGRMGIGWRNQ